MMKALESLKKDIAEYGSDRLKDGIGEGVPMCDLHQELFNMDYFIIGRYDAERWLADQVFAVIEEIKEYEKSNFGEVNTDFSEPEKVANMYAFIIGEELLSDCDLVQDDWDSNWVGPEDLDVIAGQILEAC